MSSGENTSYGYEGWEKKIFEDQEGSKKNAEGYLADFVVDNDKDSLFKFFYSMCEKGDIKKIKSFIESLPKHWLKKINAQDIEKKISRDESYYISRAKNKEDKMAIKKRPAVLGMLEKAIDKAMGETR